MFVILNGYQFESPVDFCLWGWVMGEVHKRMMDIPDELLARILVAAARIKVTRKINSDKQHAIFAHTLHSVLRLTAGLAKTYCEL
jgi:hypothetical protein